MDIIFIVIVLVAVIRCVYRGFIAEVLSVAALLAGIIGAVLLVKPASRLLIQYAGIERAAPVIAFLAVFLIIYIVVKILEGLLHRMFEALHIEKLDRALGFFLGIVEGLLVCVVIVFVLTVQPFIDVQNLLYESRFAQLALTFLPRSIPFLIEKVAFYV